MNTNNIRFAQFTGVGTYRPQIDVGIRYYARQNGYSITAGRVTNVTLSGMKNHLNNKQLLLVSVKHYDKKGPHSIVVNGYSSNTLYVQNGWSPYRKYQTFNSLNIYKQKAGDIAQYVYVGS